MGAILLRCSTGIVRAWLTRAKQSSELNHISLSDEERTGHLPKLVEDLALRLSKPRATTRTAMLSFPPPPWLMESCDICKATLQRCWCMNREYSR